MANTQTISLFEIQKYRDRFDFCKNSNQGELTEKEQEIFIDNVVRSADSNGELVWNNFPAIVLQKVPYTDIETQIYGQRFEVLKNGCYFETLQKFLSSEMSIPLSLQNCPLFKDYDPTNPYCKYDKGNEIHGQFSLLPDEIRMQIWNIKYPVEIQEFDHKVPLIF